AAVAMEPVPPLPQRDDLPEGLEAVVMKALHKDRDKRFQSAFELIEALAPFGPQRPLRVESAAKPAMGPLVPVLGSLLIQRGVIDAAQLRRALDQQAIERRPLGHILVAQGAC